MKINSRPLFHAALLAGCMIGFGRPALVAAAVAEAKARPPIVSTIGPLPVQAVSGGKVRITVHYDVADKLGQVTLHVEMKGRTPAVHEARTPKVSGRGSKTFTFAVPDSHQEDQIRFAVWYGEHWTRAVIPIVQTRPIAVLSRAGADRLAAKQKADRIAAKAWRDRNGEFLADGPGIAILDDHLPGLDRELATQVARALRKKGLRVLPLRAGEIANSRVLTTQHFHALVLSNASVYPAEGGPILQQFLEAGGDLIALGTPAFTRALTRIGGKWMDADQWAASLAKQKPEQILWDFAKLKASDIDYVGGPGSKAKWNIEPGGPKAGGANRALHCRIPRFRSWNTLVLPKRERPFGSGQTLTCLWARGAEGTTHLALEWAEKDGSRWTAVVGLTPKWKYYVLAPEAFKYWHDNPSKSRGHRGDGLRPEQAAQLKVGLAMTHTPVAPGRREFWVGPIGVASSPFGSTAGPGAIRIAPIEMITPRYKFHHVTNAKTLKVSDKQCLLPPTELPVPAGLMSVHPRPQGTGYNKGRYRRWIPLLEAFDERGEVCGTPACIVLHRTGRYADVITASFALPRAAFGNPKLLDMVAAVAARMRDGTFLFEGGAERYAYFAGGKQMVLGARTIHLAAGPMPECRVAFTVRQGVKVLSTLRAPLKNGHASIVRPHVGQDVEVSVELCRNGRVIDRLVHPVVYWRPPKKPNYMTIRDGHFYSNGKRWIAHGVNYMPSSGIATEDWGYFENWMGERSYDPVVIERDLKRIKAMGMNMVSIFVYHQALRSGNLLDILERCRRHGLLVNLSLRPGCPVRGFYWDKVKALIETYRLPQHDIIFAYDLSWEPMWRGYAERSRWDRDWEKWIVNRYGSLANAEKDWARPPSRKDGKVTGPSDKQMGSEGPHRVMVCAYRRFLDDLLDRKWADARDRVRSIDLHHPVSFRMTTAGDPTFSASRPAYDFRGLARAVEIMEPEGYGRIGDWDRVRPGRFTVDYARCTAPGRPVMWAELGCSSWDRQKMDRSPDREKWVGDYYRRFYRMALEADSDGTVCWWYPGGFRLGENSDYGIINPDGTWRPNSHAIADWAQKMTAPRPARKVDAWIRIDRAPTARGLIGVYDQVKGAYWKLIEAGKTPGLRRSGHGLDSATAPPVAVGNRPYKPGRNPHKYLNAHFDRIEYKDVAGRWRRLADGSVVKLRKRADLVVRAVVGNTGPAKWLARSGRGQVKLTCGKAAMPIPRDVGYAETITIESFRVPTAGLSAHLTFQMCALANTPFGAKVQVRVKWE